MFAHSQDEPAVPAEQDEERPQFTVMVSLADDVPLAYLGVDGQIHLVISNVDGMYDHSFDGETARRIAAKLIAAAEDYDDHDW